jgi:sugar/nucleoside kinase (ribokinase family)
LKEAAAVATPLRIILFWQGVRLMLGVVGSLSLDLVAGAPPRPGGAVFYAAEALRLLGMPARILARCAPADQVDLFGVDVEWLPAAVTTAFAFSYDGDVRTMSVLEVGDPWRREDVEGRLLGVQWLHVGGLLRTDFPRETIQALAQGRRLSLDGQALARPGRKGPLRLDGDADPSILAAAQIVTLSEEEANVLGDVPVPEVVITLGSRGSILYADGEEHRIEIAPVTGVDPTGAGDAFAVGYLAARSNGEVPLLAARRASDLVTELLSRR